MPLSLASTITETMFYLSVPRGSRTSLSVVVALPLGLALATAGSVQPAHALLTYNIFETTDGNVVVQTDGSLNLPAPFGDSACEDTDGAILSLGAVICTGIGQSVNTYAVSGPISFNGTVDARPASSVSGVSTFLLGLFFPDIGLFGIDESYNSGTQIISSATFNNTTLKGLGFTTTGLIGTWDLLGTNQRIQVVLTEVPGPLPLFGAGAAFAFSRRLRRRIAASQSATPRKV